MVMTLQFLEGRKISAIGGPARNEYTISRKSVGKVVGENLDMSTKFLEVVKSKEKRVS